MSPFSYSGWIIAFSFLWGFCLLKERLPIGFTLFMFNSLSSRIFGLNLLLVGELKEGLPIKFTAIVESNSSGMFDSSAKGIEL